MRRTAVLLAATGSIAVAVLSGSAVASPQQNEAAQSGEHTAGTITGTAEAGDAASLKNPLAGTEMQPVAGNDNIFYLKVKHSGKCLTVRGASKAENAVVNQYRCVSGAKNQWWVTYNQGGVARRFMAYHSAKCLALRGGSTAKGTPAVQRTCDGSKDQIWFSLAPYAEGSMNPDAGRNTGDRCLDVQGASKADNAPVIVWSCNDRTNQKWVGRG
ncbi:RICIN domain-containing protein [Streptomyces anthocyanicus]|uniref:RICIN domain-containing protein n=1 Tax=Streptomyces anthocyanicus TaxID=68174 RepID=UPI003661B982